MLLAYLVSEYWKSIPSCSESTWTEAVWSMERVCLAASAAARSFSNALLCPLTSSFHCLWNSSDITSTRGVLKSWPPREGRVWDTRVRYIPPVMWTMVRLRVEPPRLNTSACLWRGGRSPVHSPPNSTELVVFTQSRRHRVVQYLGWAMSDTNKNTEVTKMCILAHCSYHKRGKLQQAPKYTSRLEIPQKLHNLYARNKTNTELLSQPC